jgi:hypothetical protein
MLSSPQGSVDVVDSAIGNYDRAYHMQSRVPDRWTHAADRRKSPPADRRDRQPRMIHEPRATSMGD